MKFDQLIVYNMRNISLEKSCLKRGVWSLNNAKTLFLKIRIDRISGSIL